ncbi:MAG TPA: hypothetical protein VGN85_11785 [Methyloceanibacter sp.]|jgi:hypothetical protein|nr:hypothetical protein [Methyloceanibacter sp.]
MDDTDDPAKLEAALEQLATEKARRRQAKIDSGEMVSIKTTVVLGAPDEDEEEAIARAIAMYPGPNDGREVHREFTFAVTGVPRGDPDQAEPAPQVQPASSEGPSPPSEEPAGSGVANLSAPSQPTYVRVTISNGTDDGDPGAISEAWYTVEDGLVVLRDSDDKVITSRAMLKGDDPAVLARSLLREVEQPKDFNRPIHYPKMGFA